MLLQYGLGSRGYILSRTILEENKIYNQNVVLKIIINNAYNKF